VNVKTFCVDALQSALDLGLAMPEDVLRHVTPDVLAAHLPRPLWARLLTAALGAPKVDATLVVETVGVANLVEHVPSALIWRSIQDVAQRSLTGKLPAMIVSTTTPPLGSAVVKSTAPERPTPTPAPSRFAAKSPLAPPPPDAVPQSVSASPSRPVAASPSRPTAVGPSIPTPAAEPFADMVSELEREGGPAQPAGVIRARPPTGRFRNASTGIGRPGTPQQRRPQAQAAPPPPVAGAKPVRRGQTEGNDEVETDVSDFREREIAVDDSQLVDWSASEETVAGDDFGRKR
jgi:hypothetical protein